MLEYTVEDFKTFFPYNFPYLPQWVEGKIYFQGDIVFNAGNFFECIFEHTQNPTTSVDWKPVQDTIENYVSDLDIEHAILEARQRFNESFGETEEDKKLLFTYLVAHFLYGDLKCRAQQGSSSYPVQAITVGNVHESYAIPTAYLDNLILAPLAQDYYGMKFLDMVYAQTVGNVNVVWGRSLP